jgi:hypothetical protein
VREEAELPAEAPDFMKRRESECEGRCAHSVESHIDGIGKLEAAAGRPPPFVMEAAEVQQQMKTLPSIGRRASAPHSTA